MDPFASHARPPLCAPCPVRLDPHLRELARIVVREDAWFLDAERLARNATLLSAPAELRRRRSSLWDLLEPLERAVLDLLSQQYEEERSGFPVLQSDDAPFYRGFGLAALVDVESARSVCVALNSRPREVRRAYLALELEGRSLARYALDARASLAKADRDRCDALRSITFASRTPSGSLSSRFHSGAGPGTLSGCGAKPRTRS